MSSGAVSYLTQGNPPVSGSNYSQTSSQLPPWYTNAAQQILNTAAQFAAQPYQPYQGPRIANQDSLTDRAYSSAAPLSATATNATTNATNTVNGAVAGNNPLGAAQPYLNAGTNPTYNTVQNYINPYNKNVTDAIAQAANQNFEHSTLPQLQSSIIGGGNITGSSTEGGNMIANAANNNNQNIINAQSAALQSGYNGALGAAQSGAANELTAGQTAGQLNSQGTANAINAGGALSNINTQGTANNISAINAENQLGQQNQAYGQSNLNLAYQDYLNQLNYPMTQNQGLETALGGLQVPTSTVNYQYGTQTGAPATSVLQNITGALTNYNTPVTSTGTGGP